MINLVLGDEETERRAEAVQALLSIEGITPSSSSDRIRHPAALNHGPYSQHPASSTGMFGFMNLATINLQAVVVVETTSFSRVCKYIKFSEIIIPCLAVKFKKKMPKLVL